MGELIDQRGIHYFSPGANEDLPGLLVLYFNYVVNYQQL